MNLETFSVLVRAAKSPAPSEGAAAESDEPVYVETQSRLDLESAAIQSLLTQKAMESKISNFLPSWAKFEENARQLFYGEE
ncbi:MAG: hypothetical protein JW834_04830 [Candidatus Diapherotrites archaeon]|nr:hypothetical protein [Candidatus Diapherotrites archaeon]